jgi:hypothetical protein
VLARGPCGLGAASDQWPAGPGPGSFTRTVTVTPCRLSPAAVPAQAQRPGKPKPQGARGLPAGSRAAAAAVPQWPQPQPLAVQFPVALCGHGNLPVTCGMPGGSLTWPVAVCRLDHWQLSCLNHPPALAFAWTVIDTVTNSPLETHSVVCYSATRTDSVVPPRASWRWRRSTFASSACSRA